MNLKFERALAMTEGPAHAAEFIRFYSQLQVQQRRLQIRAAKLVAKCNADLRKHELAQMRLEISLEREQCRTAVHQRKAEAAVPKAGRRSSRELAAAREKALVVAEHAAAEARAGGVAPGAIVLEEDRRGRLPVARRGQPPLRRPRPAGERAVRRVDTAGRAPRGGHSCLAAEEL